MCLYIGGDKRVRTATNDKVVFKILNATNSPNSFIAPYRRSRYKLNQNKTIDKFTGEAEGNKSWQLESVSFTTEMPKKLRVVNRGLHAIRTLKEARLHRNMIGGVVVRCIIPKGTPYINGQDNEIVSLSLIPVKRAV
jgi:hypothetical protein